MTKWKRGNAERNAEILAERQAGAGYKQIAWKHGITEERVRQICVNGGAAVRRRSPGETDAAT